MIVYDKFRARLVERGISQYQLIHVYKIPSARLCALRKNRYVMTALIDRLCFILECTPAELFEQREDDELRQTISAIRAAEHQPYEPCEKRHY